MTIRWTAIIVTFLGLFGPAARADPGGLVLTVGPFVGLRSGPARGTVGAEVALWYQPDNGPVMGGLDAGVTARTYYAEAELAFPTGKRSPILGVGGGPLWTREARPRFGGQATVWLAGGCSRCRCRPSHTYESRRSATNTS